MYETSHQSRFGARYWMLGAGALGRPRGMVWGRREEGSGWGTHVYLWRIHFNIWQNQQNIVKFKKKKKASKHTDSEKRAVVTRGEGGWRREMYKGDQLYGDQQKLNFSCEHAVVYTEVKLQCCTHKTYMML